MDRENNLQTSEQDTIRIAIEEANTAVADFPEVVTRIFDPLKEQLLNGQRYNLNSIPKFTGSGVYAIFLVDKSESPYDDKSRSYDINPIYIGKAVPSGSRQGNTVGTNESALLKRLKEHAKSIDNARNLDKSKFECRFLILPDEHSTLIPAAEAYIIRSLTPLWNSAIDGFGNHDPGKGRYNQSPSEWDTLHPGRAFADKCLGEKPSIENILQKLE